MPAVARSVLPVAVRRFPGLRSGVLSRKRIYLDNAYRASGRLLPISPRIAEMVYRHPEILFLYAPALGLRALVSGGLWLVRVL
jgi:hypothetical protein